MTLGKRIQQARTKKGYTQEYIALTLGVSRQAVYKWEKDLTKPDTANLMALAELLDTTVDTLLDTEEKKHRTAHCSLFRAGWCFLVLGLAAYLTGIIGGSFHSMVMVPVSQNMKMGIWFLWYGKSTEAIVLLILTVVFVLASIVLFLVGHSMKKIEK